MHRRALAALGTACPPASAQGCPRTVLCSTWGWHRASPPGHLQGWVQYKALGSPLDTKRCQSL